MDEIDQLVKDMENEAKALKVDLFKFCWYMRGSLSVSEMYELDIQDREVIGKVVEHNLEITKDSGLPFF